MEGFCANAAAAVVLIGTAHAGIPVSTTHVIGGSIMGVAALSMQNQSAGSPREKSFGHGSLHSFVGIFAFMTYKTFQRFCRNKPVVILRSIGLCYGPQHSSRHSCPFSHRFYYYTHFPFFFLLHCNYVSALESAGVKMSWLHPWVLCVILNLKRKYLTYDCSTVLSFIQGLLTKNRTAQARRERKRHSRGSCRGLSRSSFP